MSVQLKPGSGFVAACAILLNILISSSTALSPIPLPSISNSVASHICKQQSAFQDSGEIQTPVTAKPENDDATCGWYIWYKCADAQSDGTCPTFRLEACAELQVQKTGRKVKGKGKGISIQPTQIGGEPDPCENSTVQGLPNPEIVASISKFPSVVTIERGDGCKAKFCTGLILNEHWILTQQTGCLFQYKPEHPDFYQIVAGERRMHIDEGTEQIRNIAQVILHPGLDVLGLHYYKDNIALTRLSEPLEFNENVQPIDLAAIEAAAPSIATSNLKIVGWLKAQPMQEDDEMLASFIESPLDFVPIDICYDKWMENDTAERETLICAGQCVVQGDKKNQPLRNILYAQENAESVAVPVGLGPVRHLDGNPQHGVFMNIASYIPWIKETLEAQIGGQGEGETTENPEADSRIIGGEEAPRHKYTSIVNMEGQSTYVCRFHACGGTILSEDWFLTAAHCLDDWETANFTIIVGDHDLLENDENDQVVSVLRAIPHEDFDWGTGRNDIGVVKVTPPFKFTDKVQKVTLPEAGLEVSGLLMAVGWGRDGPGLRQHLLKNVEVPVVPLDICLPLWENNGRLPGDTQICAGDETSGICNGDSGGPLYIDESGEQIIVGLTSMYGTLCPFVLQEEYDPDPRSLFPSPSSGKEKQYEPDVYTRVSSFLDWIRKNAELDS